MFSSTVRRSLLARPTFAAPRTPNATRPLSQTTQLKARKDAQDKDSINTESNEYSKSESDSKSAGMEKAAFDPSTTSPEAEHDIAGKEAQKAGKVNNPLNVSPANHEISHTNNAKDAGSGNPSGGQVSKNRETQGSGGSGAPKSGGGKYGGGGSGA